MTFDELKRLVVSIWNETDPTEEHDEYLFNEFLRGYQYSLPETPRLLYIEHEGGGEGGGEDGAESCETIFSIDGVIYRVTYSYYSHHGFETEYAQASVVTPKEKTIIVYE